MNVIINHIAPSSTKLENEFLYIFLQYYKYSYSITYITYILVSVCVCVFRQHFLVEAYLIKYYRQSLSTYFYFNPFKLLYRCFDIQLKLANKFPVFNWFPYIFMPLSGYYQGRRCILQKYYTEFYLYWYNFLFFLLLLNMATVAKDI